MAMTKNILIAALMAAFSCASLQAHAALFGDDEARQAILDLRTKVDSLQQNKAEASAVLNLANQNEQLRQEIARLNGQIEVLSNEVANSQQRQKDFYVDVGANHETLHSVTAIDFLKIDVEEHEMEVLEGNDWIGAPAYLPVRRPSAAIEHRRGETTRPSSHAGELPSSDQGVQRFAGVVCKCAAFAER